jgi:hypothetical protein
MATITLKHLRTEGKLSIGDTLEHSHLGEFELVWVFSDGTLRLKNAVGDYLEVNLELPEGCSIQPCKES